LSAGIQSCYQGAGLRVQGFCHRVLWHPSNRFAVPFMYHTLDYLDLALGLKVGVGCSSSQRYKQPLLNSTSRILEFGSCLAPKTHVSLGFLQCFHI
jgi:hypothetical protein